MATHANTTPAPTRRVGPSGATRATDRRVPASDATLLHLAAQLRRAEARTDRLWDTDTPPDDPRFPRAYGRIRELIAHMAAVPAEGLPGIAAKAARLCWSLAPAQHDGVILASEATLVVSLAADLARLAPAVAAEGSA